MRNIFYIAKREFESYFLSPIAYVFIITFLVLSSWFFFKGFFVIGEADTRPLLILMPWFFLFFIHSISMGRWSEERKLGTIELLLTQPVSDLQAVLAKFIAAFLLFLLTIFLTFPIPLTVALLGDIDVGLVASGYIGLVFLGMSYLAIGIFASTITESQVVAFIIGVVVTFLLLIIGGGVVTAALPASLVPLFQYLSLSSHFSSMSRGALDSRDIIYYLSVIVFFLWLTLKVVESRGVRASFKDALALTASLFLILLTVNYISSKYFVRLDLTEDKELSLSRSTKDVLKNLDDVVNINLYFSKDLPPELKLLERDVLDVISEYMSYSHGKIKLKKVDPMEDTRLKGELAMRGILPIKVSVIKADKQELTDVYLGMSIEYRDKREVMPVVRPTINMEYELTQAILKVTSKETPSIGWYVGGDGLSYDLIREFVGKRYLIKEIKGEDLAIDPYTTPLVVVPVAKKDIEERMRDVLSKYLEGGGKIIFLIGAVDVGNTMKAEVPEFSLLGDLLSRYGIGLGRGIVVDASNEMASFRQGYMMIHIHYPYWVKVVGKALNRDNPITAGIEDIVLPWTSALNLKDVPDAVNTVIASTSTMSASVEPDSSLMPDEAALKLPEREVQPLPLIALSLPKDTSKKWSLLVVPNARFVADDFVNQFPENAVFFANAIDYLSMQEALIGIRSKGVTTRPILKTTPALTAFIRYTNILAMPVLVLMLGAFIFVSRKRRMRRLREVYCK